MWPLTLWLWFNDHWWSTRVSKTNDFLLFFSNIGIGQNWGAFIDTGECQIYRSKLMKFRCNFSNIFHPSVLLYLLRVQNTYTFVRCSDVLRFKINVCLSLFYVYSSYSLLVTCLYIYAKYLSTDYQWSNSFIYGSLNSKEYKSGIQNRSLI